MRNARVSLTGNILPIVAYKAEIDLSDEGQIKMLDAYARVFPAKGLTVTAGQMRVPFTIDAHRSPHEQYFANRSFIAKQVGNVRDVGVTLGYQLPVSLPVTLEGGLYNGTGLTNQKVWHKEVNYSAKAVVLPADGWNLTLSVQGIKPEEVWMRSYDFGAYYEAGRFHIEGEYLYKQYSDNAFQNVHSVDAFINYDLPLKKFPEDVLPGPLRHDDRPERRPDLRRGHRCPDRHRLQAPPSDGRHHLQSQQGFRTDLRLNYEKYFYPAGSIAKESEQDKVVLELMVRF